ncbi:MAG: hypothetical protein ACOYJX_01240 [Acutalibacteraceae bacterium]|jgi:hypothetical protein
MANCPKCDYHLKITDWRPNCPSCGINLVYYGMEERLLADAEKAESEHAHFQKKVDRAKASFVGSKLAIARIVFTVLPLACLFLPWAKMAISGPYFKHDVTVNMLKLGMKVAELDFGGLLELIGSPIVGTPFAMFGVALVLMLLTAVVSFFGILLLFLSCSPKGIVRNITLGSLGLVFTGVATYLFTQFNTSFTDIFVSGYSGKLQFGIFVLMAAFLGVIAINIVIAKTGGIPVKYKQTYIGGIPSEHYFAAKEAGIDVLALQLHVTEEEAAIAVKNALVEAGIMTAEEAARKPEAETEEEAESQE